MVLAAASYISGIVSLDLLYWLGNVSAPPLPPPGSLTFRRLLWGMRWSFGVGRLVDRVGVGISFRLVEIVLRFSALVEVPMDLVCWREGIVDVRSPECFLGSTEGL